MGDRPADPAAGPSRPGRAAFVVAAFGTFVAADDLFVVSTMLRPLVDDLGLVLPDDLDGAAWIVNVYLIAYLAVMPLAGRLSDVVGRRTTFVAALGLFLAGSLVVPAAGSLGGVLVGRALTALGGGALVPVALAVAGDRYEGARRVRAIGVLAAVETVGWVWGPLYGALLVRFLSWEWQFHLNVPLALLGMAAGWCALPRRGTAGGPVGWAGTAAATGGLVALTAALLGETRVQAAGGLAELEGGGGGGARWLYAAALAAFAAFVVAERRSPAPLVERGLLARPGPAAGLVVGGLAAAGLVVALVNVPLFVNVVEGGPQRAAVRAGWLLTALTAAMALTSYLGGAVAGRLGPRLPAVAGSAGGAAALAAMGWTWSAASGDTAMALQLAALGAAAGLVLAPTAAVVVDAAGPGGRGSAAALVIVARLVGFSVGLAALTAWGLRRYQQLRAARQLPPLSAPGAEEALAEAAVDIATTALAGTFSAAALALAAAAVVAVALPGAGRVRGGGAGRAG